MKKPLNFLAAFTGLLALSACIGCSSPSEPEKLNVSEEVKEKEIMESFLNEEVETKTENEEPQTAEEDSLAMADKKATLEKVNENPLNQYSCEEFLDSLDAGIKRYQTNGNAGVLKKYEAINNFPVFRACLKKNGLKSPYFQRWTDLEDAIFKIYEEQ